MTRTAPAGVVLCLFALACGELEQADEHARGEPGSPGSWSTSQAALSGNRELHRAPNATGFSQTFTTGHKSDLARSNNEFFADLGTNGRTCETCHQASAGFTIRPDQVQARFEASGGLDPLFRPVDGANAPNADVSTVEARRAAYSMLLNRGVIRVGIGIPQGAQFELIAVDDPYGYASASELSLFRRPLPATNLPFNVTIMWDGRETGAGQTLSQNLASQAAGATRGHAQQPMPLSAATLSSIVGFELGLSHAQGFDLEAKTLDAEGGRGGARHLAQEPFNPQNNVAGFDLYDAWAGLTGGKVEEARASVARGQVQFTLPRPNGGRCARCHDAHNIGTHTRGNMFDVGISDPSRRTPDMPLYTLRNLSTGEVRQSTDPGKALITGLWGDLDRFKTPSLRGVAAQAPYFHDGSVPTLDGVIDHYEREFGFTLTAQEQADLVAFLRAL